MRAIIEVARASLEADCKAASTVLRAFPRMPNGLTPDHVKVSPEWRAARSRYDAAFKALRAFNVAHKRAKKKH